MTDKEFQKQLDILSKKNAEYKSQLKKVEDEIFERYGFYPSNVDFDEFIDAFHVGSGRMTVAEVDDGMKLRT